MLGVENPARVMRRLSRVLKTPLAIKKNRAERKRAPKERNVDTILLIFQRII
jgi:hypothetical protein